MIEHESSISLNRQLELLGLSKSSYYHHTTVRPDPDALLKHLVDLVYSEHPHYGYRRIKVELAIKHDYNQKYNGNRSGTDGAGNDYYARVQDQTLSRIELSMAWQAVDWLSLQSATYRTKDAVTRFSTNVTETINYSGEMWLGAVIHEAWGSKENPLSLDGRVKRYLAYGPNVTNTSDDYWEADVGLKWAF